MRSSHLLAIAAIAALVTTLPVPAQGGSVSGQIRYYANGLPVGGVTVQLLGPTPATQQTGGTGQYAFLGLGQGTWTVEPQKVGDVNGAISTLDAVGALQATVGVISPNAQQSLACDTSGGGTVTALDAVAVLQYTVGLISSFPEACGDWVFYPVPSGNSQVTLPQVGTNTCQPGAITVQSPAGAVGNQDFLAVLVGDCNGSWTPPPTPSPTVTATPTPTPTRTPTVTLTPTIQWPQLSLNPTISGFNLPVHIANAGDGSGRLFVVEQGGFIRLIKNGVVQTTPFLDIHTRVIVSSEQGLLSVAFPPGFSGKGYFYVYYTNLSGQIVLARYHLSANPDVANPNSESILLTIDHPNHANHNGGQLAFGPDGYLYMGTGDGGGAGDQPNNAQNPAILLGKLLRLDVEAAVPTPTPYAIPTTNPTQTPGVPGRIWALGLRNPWRFSFDRLTGDLYIGDVGQNLYEEVDVQPASSTGGENYGWHIMEGFHCFNPDPCDMTGLTLPVVEYDHSLGCAVTGGLIYRGATYPCMHGVYFYGDYCSGRIWGLKRTGATFQSTFLTQEPFSISSFGVDELGNLWVADYSDGAIAQLTDACVGPTLTPTPTATPTA